MLLSTTGGDGLDYQLTAGGIQYRISRRVCVSDAEPPVHLYTEAQATFLPARASGEDRLI